MSWYSSTTTSRKRSRQRSRTSGSPSRRTAWKIMSVWSMVFSSAATDVYSSKNRPALCQSARSSSRADRLDVDRVHAQRPCRRHQPLELRGQPPRVQGAAQLARPVGRVAAAEQLGDGRILLRRAEQAHRVGVRVGRLLVAQQGVAERVERHGRGGGGGAGESPRDAAAHLVGGLAAERQDEHLLRAQRLPLDALDDGLDHGRGLAGARPGQHEEWSASGRRPVLDHGTLLVVEGRRDRRLAGSRRLQDVRGHGPISADAPDTRATPRSAPVAAPTDSSYVVGGHWGVANGRRDHRADARSVRRDPHRRRPRRSWPACTASSSRDDAS